MSFELRRVFYGLRRAVFEPGSGARGPELPAAGRLGRLVIVAGAAIVVAITYWRLFYAIDFTDESYYVATTYRLVLGAHPYIDETTLSQQTASILIYPLVWAYHRVWGLTGIVLFLRHAQFLYSLVVGYAVFASIRRLIDSWQALLIALTTVAFVPLGIHDLSYITLGGGLFTAGCFLGLSSLGSETAGRSSRLLGALAHGVAAFAYPPLLLPVAAYLVLRVALSRGGLWAEVRGYGLAALGLPVVALGALTVSAGPRKVYDDYRHASDYFGQGGGVGKVVHLATGEKSALLLVPGLLLLVAALRWRRVLVVPALLILPLFALPYQLVHAFSNSDSLTFVTHFGILALPLFFLVRQRGAAVVLLVGVWLPAFLGGATTGYASNNGSLAIAVGFLPATVVATIFLAWAVDDARVERGWGLGDVTAALPAIAVLAFLLLFETVPIYRDGPFSALTARVAHGPYAGLVTTPANRAFLTRFERDLARPGQSCTILFFNDFPGGYLLSDAVPDTNSTWTFSLPEDKLVPYQQDLVDYYGSKGFPDIVVLMMLGSTSTPAAELHAEASWPLVRMLRSHSYELVRSRPGNYLIYQRPAATCSGRPS